MDLISFDSRIQRSIWMEKQDRYNITEFIKVMDVNIEEIAALFDQYFQEMFEELIELKKLFKDNDFTMLQREIHNVKGVSANLGIYDVHQKAAIMDSNLKNNINDFLEVQIEELESLILNAHTEVQVFFKGLNLTIQ